MAIPKSLPPHLLTVALLATAACAPIGRAPESASVLLPDRFALLNAETARAMPVEALLPETDPGYTALRARAFAAAPDLEAAAARIDIARAGLRASRAERAPNIGASGGVSQSRTSSAQTGSALPPGVPFDRDRTLFSTSVDAGYDLDLFGRLRAGERAQRARLDAATADAAAVRLALTTDIAQAVTDYRTLAGRQLVVARDLASARDLVATTRARADAGIAPGFDLVRAQSLEADAQSRLGPIDSERAGVLGRLATLTAQPVTDVRAQLGAVPLAAATALPVLEVPSLLLRARPDVIAAEARLAAADAEIAAAAADRFPRLSITASLGLIALAFGDLFDGDTIAGSLGAGLAGPLLDFARVGARIDQRQAEAREAFAQYRGALFQGLGEVEAALGGIVAADTRVAALQRQASIDLDAANLARVRYQRGLDTFLTVIDAERAANRSQESAVIAQGEARRQRILLYRSIGR